mgnify:FL=1
MMGGDPKRTRLLAMDVDGVLTDGTLYLTASGDEMKAFHVRDGMGIALALCGGLEIAFVTGRSSDLVRRRATELGVRHVLEGIHDKRAALMELAERLGLAPAEIAFVGDDLNDLPALSCCGLPVAVADAPQQVRAAAAWITEAPGGRGAIREVAERSLEAQGKLDEAIARYLSGRTRQ